MKNPILYKKVPVIKTRLQDDLTIKEQAALALFRAINEQPLYTEYEWAPTPFKKQLDRMYSRLKRIFKA